MIDAIKAQHVQNTYSNLVTNQTNKMYKNNKVTTNFDIQALINQIKDCTYSEEDVNNVDEKLLKDRSRPDREALSSASS